LHHHQLTFAGIFALFFCILFVLHFFFLLFFSFSLPFPFLFFSVFVLHDTSFIYTFIPKNAFAKHKISERERKLVFDQCS